jgi:hypothetical protein
MILTFAYSSSFGVSGTMKDGDSVVIIQSKCKRTRSGSLYVTSIYLYAITISYYSMVRYKNIDNPIIVKIIGFNCGVSGSVSQISTNAASMPSPTLEHFKPPPLN